MLLRTVPARCASLIEEGVRREADAALAADAGLMASGSFYTDREIADSGTCVVIVATPNDSFFGLLRAVRNALMTPKRARERRSA